MEYEQLNLRTARLTLQERTAIVVEHDLAKRVLNNKRQEAESLRLSRMQRPDRVEAAVDEVREAQRQKDALERYLARVSQQLRESLQRHSVQTHHDLQTIMLDHALVSGRLEQRIAEMLALFDADASEAAAEAQRASMTAAQTKRKVTPAQAAAARIVGCPVEESSAADARAQRVAAEASPADGAAATDKANTEDAAHAEADAAVADEADEQETTQDSHGTTPADSSPADTNLHPPGPFFSSSLFQRDTRSGPWTKLSAADAAKTLAGTF